MDKIVRVDTDADTRPCITELARHVLGPDDVVKIRLSRGKRVRRHMALFWYGGDVRGVITNSGWSTTSDVVVFILGSGGLAFYPHIINLSKLYGEFFVPRGTRYDSANRLFTAKGGQTWYVPRRGLLKDPIRVNRVDDDWVPTDTTPFNVPELDRAMSASVLARTRYQEFADYATAIHPLLYKQGPPKLTARASRHDTDVATSVDYGTKEDWHALVVQHSHVSLRTLLDRVRQALRYKHVANACVITHSHDDAPDRATALRWVRQINRGPYA